ncbi:gastrotropin-like isoform X2 [Hyla sarda]|uniref:gastrotropin-like isoform X2 n=1 Tax=Hyla sarda TaxID=327740 RepID=UPI0024C44A89|nr:gastrotropin-like isoform X2 [Hyla sarda]
MKITGERLDGSRHGIPAETIQKGKDFKFTTEVVQNGNDFTWSQIYPGHTMTNTFTIGKESEMETMSGKKFKATVQLEGGKIVVDFGKYKHSSEIVGGNLVEVSEAGGVSFKRISKRIA